jgi:hypothetical protein
MSESDFQDLKDSKFKAGFCSIRFIGEAAAFFLRPTPTKVIA